MAFLELGIDHQNRKLLLLSVKQLSAIEVISLDTIGPFGLFVTTDAKLANSQDLSRFTRTMTDRGCTMMCSWGPDCERIHDIFDETQLDTAQTGVLMTTWHDDETLDDAIEYLVMTACEDENYSKPAEALLAVSIGSPTQAEQVRRSLERFVHKK